MEARDWISLAGIISTLIVALTTMLISHRRELRQEKTRKEEREQEHKQRIEEKRLESQYSKLHEKRAEALSELYDRLTKASDAMKALPIMLRYTASVSDEAKIWATQAYKDCCDCESFFAKNRLYLSTELAKQIGDVLTDLSHSAGNIKLHQEANDLDELTKDLTEWHEKSIVVPETLARIESEFRVLLGSSG